jgi:hypothetical protein
VDQKYFFVPENYFLLQAARFVLMPLLKNLQLLAFLMLKLKVIPTEISA